MKLKSHNKLINLNQNLKSKIFGQDHVINKITNILKVNSIGLGDENKPIGSFLFTGSTGVGKTELAIQLAKELNMDFKRFDMSEYSDKHSIQNFIGGIASYVGYEDGGLLVNYMMEYPKSVILFDEIEKAHKDVMNVFLQILDYSLLTSTKGEKAFFNDSIIIFTSNLCVLNHKLRKTMGFISNYVFQEDIDDENKVDTYLKPEFRGRIDSIIPFNNLSKEMISLIIDKNLNELKYKLSSYNLDIKMSEELRKNIIESLVIDNLGARSIAKIFKNTIKTLIANEILSNNITIKSKINICMNNDTNEIYLKVLSQKEENLEKDLLTYIPWFSNVIEAQEYAKKNPMILITRSPCGNGFIAKKYSN